MKSSRTRGRTVSTSIDANRSGRSSSVAKPSRQARDGSMSRNIRAAASASVAGGTSNSVSNKNKRRSKFYNVTCGEKPTELFRTDLISNMTVADSEPLNNQQDLIVLSDTWRREWNDGVQVPVHDTQNVENPEKDSRIDNLKSAKDNSSPSPTRQPVPVYYEVDTDSIFEDTKDPPRKLRNKGRKTRSKDLESKIGHHTVHYELDDLDIRWLRLINASLSDCQFPRFLLNEDQLEKAVEMLEVAYVLRCADEEQSPSFIRQKSESDAVCDVCRGEFSEDGNLLVFCDRCNLCVHQACYGIARVPSGPWVCRPCSMDLRPSCVLCPNRGGALKPTKSGHSWAHVSCAVWIPEIAFGSPSLKEPVIGISRIPEDRWMLQCEICEQRGGACIQCSVRNCHVSFHVTCAQRAGWKVTYKESVPEDGSDDVLENFCKKHSKNWAGSQEDQVKIEPGAGGYFKSASSVAYPVLIGLTYSDLEYVFERFQQIPVAFRRAIFYYWKTKRLSSPGRILIFDINECQLALERDREAEFICRRVDYLISLRQTLEKTRTLCYMVEKREKLKRQWIDKAVDEYDLVSNTNSGTSNVDQFLETFPLTYQPEVWLPKERKMAQLSSIIPEYSHSSTSTSSPAPRRRGRRPKVERAASGGQSPLAIVNVSSSGKRQKKKVFSKRRGSSAIESQDGDDHKETKRKRIPRVQYSPT